MALLRRRTVQSLAAALGASLLVHLVFSQLSWLELANSRADDFLLATAAPASDGPDPRVTLVTITESVLAGLPYRAPIDRGFLAGIVDRLRLANVRAVGFDILFDQPTEAGKDAALIAAMREMPGRVVVAWGDYRAGLIEQQSAWLAGFIEASGAVPGFADLELDPDGVVRRFTTHRSGTDYASLPAALARAGGYDPGTQGGLIGWRRTADSKTQAFATIPASAVLKLPPPVLQRVLQDRIVLIGADLPQADRHRTSLSDTDAGAGDPLTAGVLVQAHILSQLVEGRTVPEFGYAAHFAILLLMALVGSALATVEAPLLVRVGGVLVALLGLAYVAYLAASNGWPLVPLASPAISAAVAYMAASGLANWTTGREKKQIRTAFGQYLAPALVAELASDPSKLRLGGERREMSFIFTDIAGFTSLSEQLTPERLTQLLNDYLDGMSEIVLKHGGTIDKFIGDAVVAMFGAPAAMPDHAERALACAIEMDRFCEQFRAGTELDLGITRIGVHSGDAVVGNFGGRQRFDYTAMGDTMNVAARLEAANKHFGTRVAISGATLDRIADRGAALARAAGAALVPVGNVMLKGKDLPVPIYSTHAATDRSLVDTYLDVMAALDRGDSDAPDRIAALAQEHPDYPLASLHAGRIAKGERGVTFRLNEK
ncbi:MAG: adenylate/guanylate cyclase domain-containing protein [Pseudomonadota bacterium]|nr:adenylate/guanylate cyclase domain-containing protein [Pseudomonadota bacterium]